MNLVRKFWPVILIFFVVLIFFTPIFKGKIPFPGDLLVNQNPYVANSYFGFTAGGFPNKAQGPDVINEIYPWRYFSFDQIKHGQLPFWNPYNFSGNPQLANFQTGVFYPFNILYILLPFNISWTLIIMLQPLLAAIFMYVFLKKSVALSSFACVLGGISFAFCSYMSVWIEYGNIGSTILWLPIILFFTKRFFQKDLALGLLGVVIASTFSILAGYIQGVFYIYILSFFYFIYLQFTTKEKDFKKIFFFLVSLSLPLLITAFQILPTLELFSNSTRGAYSLLQIEKNLSPVFNLITVVFPDFFGNPATRNYWIDGTYIERVMYPGSVILFFALYTLFSKTKFSEKKFFTITAIVSLLVAVNFPLVKFLYLIPIPVISTTVATRELSIFIFSIIVLGAMGIDIFLKEGIVKRFTFFYLFLLFLTGSIVFILSKLNWSYASNLNISMHNLILPGIIIAVTAISIFLKRKDIRITKIILIVIVVFDLFYFFQKITPFADATLTYPKTAIVDFIKQNAGINRFWGYGSAYMPPNFQSVDKTYSSEGNDPLHLASYGILLSSSLNGSIPNQVPRPDANIAPGYGSSDLKTNSYRKRILDLLGVKYIVNKIDLPDAWENPDDTTFPKDQYKMVAKVYPWQVYQNLSSVPRAFITGKYLLAKDKTQSLSLIYNPSIDLKTSVILEQVPKIKVDANAKGSVMINSYEPNKINLKTTSDGNGILFLSDNYYKDWRATVDGKSSQILIADYSFRALEISSGNHNIEFYYDPIDFKVGILISAFGFLILIFIISYVKKNFKK